MLRFLLLFLFFSLCKLIYSQVVMLQVNVKLQDTTFNSSMKLWSVYRQLPNEQDSLIEKWQDSEMSLRRSINLTEGNYFLRVKIGDGSSNFV